MLISRWLVVLSVVFAIAAEARADDIWHTTLKTIQFAATAKASFKAGCDPANPISRTPSSLVLCPKLDAIPDSVIEEAALPYLKQHISEKNAQDAIAFWSSDRGKALTKKILLEIEQGVYKHLDADDLRALASVNRTQYGRALKAFATDPQQNRAVARAMLSYEP